MAFLVISYRNSEIHAMYGSVFVAMIHHRFKVKHMICTYYSHYIGFEKITDLLQKEFPKGILSISDPGEDKMAQLVIKGGLFSPSVTIKVSYRERAFPSYQLPEFDDSPLTANLKGLYGYITSLPATNEQLKHLLLAKVATINSEFSVEQEPQETKDIIPLLQKLATEFDAIIFTQPGTLISKSGGQHFLDHNLDLILDTSGNSEIEKLSVNIESKYFNKEQSQLSDDQIRRKERSEAILKVKGIKVNSSLPCIDAESETLIRTPKEIATRLCILAVTNFVANNVIPADIAIAYLQQYDLWAQTTPAEKEFLGHPTEERKNTESWKSECIYTLMWALGKIDELNFPYQLCDLNDIPEQDYPVGAGKDPNTFINSISKTRSAAEILDANDLYYRIDWACIDVRLANVQLEEAISGVVYERHYALNWLIRYGEQDWDDVSCDT